VAVVVAVAPVLVEAATAVGLVVVGVRVAKAEAVAGVVGPAVAHSVLLLGLIVRRRLLIA